MNRKEYLVKDTGTVLDDMVVLCDETEHAISISENPEPVIFKEVVTVIESEGEFETFGILLHVNSLVPLFQGKETPNPCGQYLKSYSYETREYHLNIVEFENTLQVSVTRNKSAGKSHLFKQKQEQVLYSEYHNRANLFNLKKKFEDFLEGLIDVNALCTKLEGLD